MVNAVEEFLKIDVNYDSMSFSHKASCFPHCVVTPSFWTEAITVFGEGWVKHRRQYLRDRLLNEAICHGWYP
jgi:hypothetical protein